MHITRTRVALFLSGIALLNNPVHGAGFQLQEQGVKGLGNAYAGGAAVAEDAATVAANPAGLTRLPAQLVAGGHFALVKAEFRDRASTNPLGGASIGRRVSDGGGTIPIPNFFYSRPLNDRLTLGIAATPYFGLQTNYNDDWVGRYHAVDSELITFALNPALGYRVNDRLSLGAGFTVQYAEALLSNALDFGTLASLAGAPGVRPADPAFDGFSKVEGDDWGFGFNLGLLFQATPDTRFGLAYRSRIEHSLSGDSTLTIPEFAQPLAGPSRVRDARADFSTPASLSLSVHHRLDPQWALMADLTWMEWSSFEEIRIRHADGSPDAVQPQNWEDTFRFALGVSYEASEAWTLRAGLAYDESPVPGVEHRTPRIPDNDRRWLALGASYRPAPGISLDFGLARLFINDTAIRDTEPTTGGLADAPIGNTLNGQYRNRVDLFSAQLNWSF